MALEKNKGAIQELKIKRKFENQEKIEEEDEDITSSDEDDDGSDSKEKSVGTSYVADESIVSQKVLIAKKQETPSEEVMIQVDLTKPVVTAEPV